MAGAPANGFRVKVCGIPGPSAAADDGPGAPSFVVWKYPGVGATCHITKKLVKSYFFIILEEMAERNYLGEFELMIMLVVVQLGDQAYGVPVCRELGKHREQEVSIGSVYAALERLEAKGLISSRLGESTQERGGRAKRYFRATKEGLRVVRETRRVLTSLWRKLPDLNGEAV